MSAIDGNELLFENDHSKECRICFSNDSLNDMISPCLCSGTIAYVHRKCLDYSRLKSPNSKASSFCNMCRFKYVVQIVTNNDRKDLLIYYLLVIRDFILVSFWFPPFIALLALFLKISDADDYTIQNLFPNSFNEFLRYCFSAMKLLLIIGLIIVILTLLCAFCSFTTRNGLYFPATFKKVHILFICAFFLMAFLIHFSFMNLQCRMEDHNKKLELKKCIVQNLRERNINLEKDPSKDEQIIPH